MSLLFIDIETYSTVDIKKSNVYRYSEDPQFEILMAAWATEDRVVHVAIGEQAIRRIPGLFNTSTTKVAHNAGFERVCFSRLNGLPVGRYRPVAEYEDTMALAGEWGYPQGLDALARAVGAEQKDSAGTRLINFFCKPNRNGERNMPEDHPEKFQEFVEYCRQDVVTMIDVYDRLMDKYGGWPTEIERAVWEADQRINDRGLAIDTELAQSAMEAAADNQVEQMEQMRQITGLDNPNSNVQLLGWFQEQGEDMRDLKADTVTARLQDAPAGPVRTALELRQELALVASKKYSGALERSCSDARLRGSFQFFGAHTGRWAGRGVQPQNLPSATLPSDTHVEAAILDLAMGNGASAHTLKALVRSLFVGPFTVVDYSAIEARVVAWLAGEQWALDAFAKGRDIYIETAARMFNLSYEEATARRKEGKVAVLALGYNGGIGSLRVMGAQGTDRQLQFLVDQWREANENTAGMWRELEHAFRAGDTAVGDHLYVAKDGRDRLIQLPSGRAIVYHDCRAVWETDKYGNRRKRVTFADPKKQGARTGTYGGKLTENATQAVARDILAEALLRLHKWGYGIAGHVHDEILIDGVGTHSVQAVATIMNENPTWAKGLPIAAEGFKTERYRKG